MSSLYVFAVLVWLLIKKNYETNSVVRSGDGIASCKTRCGTGEEQTLNTALHTAVLYGCSRIGTKHFNCPDINGTIVSSTSDENIYGLTGASCQNRKLHSSIASGSNQMVMIISTTHERNVVWTTSKVRSKTTYRLSFAARVKYSTVVEERPDRKQGLILRCCIFFQCRYLLNP